MYCETGPSGRFSLAARPGRSVRSSAVNVARSLFMILLIVLSHFIEPWRAKRGLAVAEIGRITQLPCNNLGQNPFENAAWQRVERSCWPPSANSQRFL